MLNVPAKRGDAPARNEDEHLDRLLRVSAPHERLVLACAGLVLLAFAGWLFLGTVAHTVTAEGVLIAPGERHMAISTEPGQLLEYLVAPGDRVTAGQPVARQTVPVLDREMSVLLDRINLLQAEHDLAGSDALRKLLDSAQVALLGIEASRTTGQTIVSPQAGEVMALVAAPGMFLEAGAAVALVRTTAEGPPRAVLGVDQDTARRLRPGMPAWVEFPAPDGGTRRLDGEVAYLAAGPAPVWLARLMPWAPASWHRVDIALHQAPDFPAPDGVACRIRIELDRLSPASLLVTGRS